MAAEESINPNVVLTADNSQYDQAMMASAGSTDQLGKSIDTLTQKVKGLTKTAGKGLIGIAAADIAMITGATAAWASYEKQVSQLNAQAAILTRSQTQQQTVFKQYEKSVAGVRQEFGTTTTEAAKLTQTLAKMTSLRQTRELGDLSKVFVEMSKATGENSDGLATSLISLQKVMGTDVNARNTRRYADQFTYLSAQTGGSAQQLIEFTKQLAPIGRQIGITQTELAGFATAFSRAGEDGFQAANVFNKVVNDISYSMQSGSPEVAKFANLVGVTQNQFKKMEGGEKVVQILEALQAMGPRAATELNRLGLDGTRSMRSITAVVNQAGGIREALGMAESDQAKGSAHRGAEKAMEGLSDEFEKLREEMKMTAESMATLWGPAATGFMSGAEKMASTMRKIVQGPFGEFAQLIAGILAPLAGGAGAMLLFAGALLKMAGAFTLFRNSGAYGFREAMRGAGGPIVRQPDGTYMATGAGKHGQQIAQGGTWVQRGLYNAGAAPGSMYSNLRDRYIQERLNRDPNWRPNRFVRDWQARGGLPLAPLSYAAGAMGAGMRQLLVPQYDQMRYADPTDRSTWMQQTAPWMRAKDRANLSRAMGDVGKYSTRMEDTRAQIRAVHSDPWMTTQERQTKLDGLRATRAETQQKLTAATQQERAAAKIIDTHQRLATASDGARKGMAGLTQGFRQTLGAMAGATFGGLRAGAGATPDMAAAAMQNRRMAMMTTGAMGMAVMGATGVESNMAQLGAMGMMFGPTAAAAGAGIGAFLDMKKAPGDIAESIEATREIGQQVMESGTGFMEYQKAADADLKRLQEYKEDVETARPHHLITDPSKFLTSVGATVGIGPSEQELTGEWLIEDVNAKLARGVARDIARESGVKFKGTTEQRDAQLEQWMATEGAAKLTAASLDFEDLVKERNLMGGPQDAEYMSLLMRVVDPGQRPGVEERVRRTAAGGVMMNSSEAQKAIRYQEDVGAFYDATNTMLAELRDKGLSYQEIIKSSEKTQQILGDPNSREYELQTALSGRAQAMIQFNQPYQTRTAGFKAQIGAMGAIMGVKPRTDEQAEQFEQTRDTFVQSVTEQYQYFQQLLYQQREFDISMARGLEDFNLQRDRMDEQYHLGRQRQQDDFHLSRVRQEQDYQLGRERAEFDYNLQRERGSDDYFRSVRRSQADFNRNRRRQEQDHNHQVVLMAEQAAKQLYSIYDRVKVESTNSATYLLYNAGDQLQKMREQSQNLDELRQMGVSDDVIQQMGLTDTANSQQLERFVAELADNPNLVKQFNKQIRQRLKAARELVTDESSSDWEEFQRQYRISRRRAANDFERSVQRGHKDFQRQMDRMEEDFQRSMNRQAEDYEKAQKRQQQDFSKSMKRGAEDYGIAVDQMTDDFHKSQRRAAEDLERSAEEITGSLTKMLRKATNELGGNAADQAGIVLEALRDLRREAGMEGNSLMEVMSEIFGFDFKPVKVKGPRKPGDIRPGNGVENDTGKGAVGGVAAGGVLPGYTPGKDVHQFHSATAGDLHLSGGEAIMVPEWVQAVGGPAAVARMNTKARSRTGPVSFASGGIPALGEWSAHSHADYDWTRWAGDINIPGSGDYGNPVRAYKPGTVAAVVYMGDQSYGRYIKINHPDSNEQTLYAHLSRARVDVGDEVKRGEVIGNVGDIGRTSGPHLHFEIMGGTGPIQTGGGVSVSPRRQLSSILKDRYPDLEAAAAKVTLGGGFPEGWWSKRMNRWARKAYNQMAPRGAAGSDHQGIPPSPADGSNQELMHKAMKQFGWNQWNALYKLEMGEAGFDNHAQNPTSTAYGMGQFLDSTWATVGGHKTSDPWLQSVYMMRYIKENYGDPRNAYRQWASRSPHWYGDGALFDSPQTIGVGEKGPEAVIPLNERGADFIYDIMQKTKVGAQGKAVGLTGSTPVLANTIHNYQIDRSTTFTGAITVQANNPGELIHQLRARQRTAALSQAAIGGARV